MLNGDPLPADVRFPNNHFALQEMRGTCTCSLRLRDALLSLDVIVHAGADLQRLIDAYGLHDGSSEEFGRTSEADDGKRKVLKEFFRGSGAH